MTKADKYMGITAATARKREPAPEPEKRPPARKYVKRPWAVMRKFSWRRGDDDPLDMSRPYVQGHYAKEAQAVVVCRKEWRRIREFKIGGGLCWIVQPDGTAYTPI